MLTKEKKQELIKEYGGSKNNSGATEAQIAILTHRISELTNHLKDHQKDHDGLRSLRQMVHKRKRLLKYLRRKDIEKYRDIIKDLKIRTGK